MTMKNADSFLVRHPTTGVIAVQSFVVAVRDPETGKTRDIAITVNRGMLLVGLSKSRAPGEDSPHHATADFSPHATVIVKALTGS